MQFTLKESEARTKSQQLIQSLTEAIENGQLKAGDPLPSVNQLSRETGFSRDTVFKMYQLLKQRNIVESTPQKGYFVAGAPVKVLMLLDDFSAFKEQLYRSFRENLPELWSVDLLFHHYNMEIFEQLVQRSIGRYGVYVVMNIDHQTVHPLLDKLDTRKLLLLDMGTPSKDTPNYLLQDFSKSVKQCLEKGIEKIRKYEEFVLVYAENITPHPADTVSAVREFCRKNQINFRIVASAKEKDIREGVAYFVIHDSDLVEIIKTCRDKKLKLGRDVGIISYNDTPMKEIVGGGITVISTDFEMMGKKAAQFVKNRKKTSEVLETTLIFRDSL